MYRRAARKETTTLNLERPTNAAPTEPRAWARILVRYHQPSRLRSIGEIALTVIPLVALWLLAWAALSVGVWLALPLSAVGGLFLLRLFAIQHDCGHGALFRGRRLNDWLGRVLGVFTLTPYDVWRRAHALHHAGTGNLERRGLGDVDVLTVREYIALSPLRRLCYRLYRHPVVMFGIGPAYLFLLRHRLPIGQMRGGATPWVSAMATNAAIAALAGCLIWLVGLVPFVLVQGVITLVAASAGVWLFYVQHQFDGTTWTRGSEWDRHDAALHGSSHYDLPRLLSWLTANIGVHHVHHLSSRIPCYRLEQVMRDHPELAARSRLTLRQSLRCTRLALWCENKRRLISFREMSRSAVLGDGARA